MISGLWAKFAEDRLIVDRGAKAGISRIRKVPRSPARDVTYADMSMMMTYSYKYLPQDAGFWPTTPT